MTDGWRNRIVGQGEKPVSEFLANPYNWRIHPQYQAEALRGVLGEVGWVQNVVENARTGNLIDGHLRIMEALRLGDDTPVPYVQVDLSEEEERLILATLDPMVGLAVADKEKLEELLREVEAQAPAVREMLAGLAEKENLRWGPELGPELDEHLADGVSLCVCPECGHEHAKVSK